MQNALNSSSAVADGSVCVPTLDSHEDVMGVVEDDVFEVMMDPIYLQKIHG